MPNSGHKLAGKPDEHYPTLEERIPATGQSAPRFQKLDHQVTSEVARGYANFSHIRIF